MGTALCPLYTTLAHPHWGQAVCQRLFRSPRATQLRGAARAEPLLGWARVSPPATRRVRSVTGCSAALPREGLAPHGAAMEAAAQGEAR